MPCACAEEICRSGSISKNHQLTNLNKCEKFHACIRNSTILALSRLAKYAYKILTNSSSNGQLSLDSLKINQREAIIIWIIQNFEADFLWKVSLEILNTGIILKTCTHGVKRSLTGKLHCS